MRAGNCGKGAGDGDAGGVGAERAVAERKRLKTCFDEEGEFEVSPPPFRAYGHHGVGAVRRGGLAWWRIVDAWVGDPLGGVWIERGDFVLHEGTERTADLHFREAGRPGLFKAFD